MSFGIPNARRDVQALTSPLFYARAEEDLSASYIFYKDDSNILGVIDMEFEEVIEKSSDVRTFIENLDKYFETHGIVDKEEKRKHH